MTERTRVAYVTHYSDDRAITNLLWHEPIQDDARTQRELTIYYIKALERATERYMQDLIDNDREVATRCCWKDIRQDSSRIHPDIRETLDIRGPGVWAVWDKPSLYDAIAVNVYRVEKEKTTLIAHLGLQVVLPGPLYKFDA